MGTTLVSYTATDVTGNQGTCTFNIIVVEGRCVVIEVQVGDRVSQGGFHLYFEISFF